MNGVSVSNHASALGGKVGHVLENAIHRNLMPVIEKYGFTAKSEKMKNGSDNRYQIDLVVRDSDDKPVILFESKYIRYKKHNRDKGSWLCTAHHNLKKTHPTIRKLTAILAGNWSEPSLEMLRSFGVEPFLIPFKSMVEVLGKYGVKFDWAEKDKDTPRQSLETFDALSDKEKLKIGDLLVSNVIEAVKNDMETMLKSDKPIERRVSNVEIVLRTELNESYCL